MTGRRRTQTVDRASIANRTWMSNNIAESYLEKADKITNDPEKKERLKAQQCKVCYYVAGRIGGAMITDTECGLCKKEMSFCSTCTDMLCIECASKHDLCLHCGGDIKGRAMRRKFEGELA